MMSSTLRLLTGAALAAAVHCAWAQAPDTGALRFDIRRFEVQGNTLLAPAEVDAAVAKFAGSGRDFGDVQRALEALEAVFHAHGYKLVTVHLPEQELNGGVVRLEVVQARIAHVTVRGNQVFEEANIRRSLPGLQVGQTPNLDRVSAQLRMANENPAKKTTLKLQSAADDEQLDALLEVSDERAWKAMLNLDNSGSGPTGSTHAGVVLQNANLWGRDHVASLQYTTSAQHPSQVSVYGAGYHLPLYALGDSIDLFASYSNVDSGSITAGLLQLGVSGKGSSYGARYNQLLARRGAYDARLVYGLDARLFKNTVLLGSTDFGNDVAVHPLSVAYTGTQGLPNGDASFTLGLAHNVSGGKHGQQADFTLARSGAQANYSVLHFAGAYNRAFAQYWQLRLTIAGQWSGAALVPGEQFGAGGAASVRGFGERVLATDSGATGNIELFSPSWCVNPAWQCRAVGFLDAAYGSRNHALPGELDSASIASAGLGLRLSMGSALNLQADYGHVLKRGALGGNDQNKLHVRLGLAY
ncbi:MAG: ShlB/FhaC/HecB family hemolysin secretion/activation protein [Pseudomonadota bacterium]